MTCYLFALSRISIHVNRNPCTACMFIYTTVSDFVVVSLWNPVILNAASDYNTMRHKQRQYVWTFTAWLSKLNSGYPLTCSECHCRTLCLNRKEQLGLRHRALFSCVFFVQLVSSFKPAQKVNFDAVSSKHVNRLLVKLKFRTVDKRPGSGRRHSARTDENVDTAFNCANRPTLVFCIHHFLLVTATSCRCSCSWTTGFRLASFAIGKGATFPSTCP